MGVYEKPQDDKECDLQEPSKPVEEGGYALLVDDLLIPDEDTHDVDGEVAVA